MICHHGENEKVASYRRDEKPAGFYKGFFKEQMSESFPDTSGIHSISIAGRLSLDSLEQVLPDLDTTTIGNAQIF